LSYRITLSTSKFKGRLKGENSLDATANEIVQAAVHISKELDA